MESDSVNYSIKTGQARVGLAHRGFRTKIGGLELFLKLKLSLARALSSDTSLGLAAIIPNFANFSFHKSTESTLLILIPFIM